MNVTRLIGFDLVRVCRMLCLSHVATSSAGDMRDTSKIRDRIPTNFRSVELVRESPWFLGDSDSGAKSCWVWSLINSAYLLGKEPPPECVRDLLNCANDYSKPGGGGLSGYLVVEILERHPQFGIKLEAVDSFCGSFSVNPEGKKAVIQRNAELIKEILDDRNGLIVSVNENLYYENRESGSHAICVSGYKVDSGGFIDVEVIDSALGRYWIPLEDLTYACRSFDGCAAYKIISLN